MYTLNYSIWLWVVRSTLGFLEAIIDSHYPRNIEDALEILTVFGGKFHNPKKPRESEIQFMQKTEMMQKGLCFKCKKKGHKAQDCPAKEQKDKTEEQKGETKEQSKEHQFLLNNEDEMTFDFMS